VVLANGANQEVASALTHAQVGLLACDVLLGKSGGLLKVVDGAKGGR
jgi:hypothetical protein